MNVKLLMRPLLQTVSYDRRILRYTYQTQCSKFLDQKKLTKVSDMNQAISCFEPAHFLVKSELHEVHF